MSLWRKRKTSDTVATDVHHSEQNQSKWFNITALANNDLSIKSEDLSIKLKKIDDDDDIQEYKKPWQPLNWGDMPIGQVNNFDFMEGARWAEKSLKDKNI
jgi:hypothetical protein